MSKSKKHRNICNKISMHSPACGDKGFNQNKPAYFYIIETDSFIGYGISRSIKNRFRVHENNLRDTKINIIHIEKYFYDDGSDAWDFEQYIKQKKKWHVDVGILGFRTGAMNLKFKKQFYELIDNNMN